MILKTILPNNLTKKWKTHNLELMLAKMRHLRRQSSP
jgi:hypothetical protein